MLIVKLEHLNEKKHTQVTNASINDAKRRNTLQNIVSNEGIGGKGNIQITKYTKKNGEVMRNNNRDRIIDVQQRTR